MNLPLLSHKESTSPLQHCTIILWCSLICFLLVSPVIYAIDQNEIPCEKPFDFIAFSPTIQYPGKPVTVSCIIYPSSDIDTVTVVLTTPSQAILRMSMSDEMNGIFSCRIVNETTGRYWFFIEVDTRDCGVFQSDLFSFWISSSQKDRDGDGILDAWEQRNGLDPDNPYDATVDSDLDGFSNRKEFCMDTDPMRHEILDNALYLLNERQTYFFISFMLCIMLCFFSWFGMRRMMI